MEHRESPCVPIFPLLWARVSQTLHFLWGSEERDDEFGTTNQGCVSPRTVFGNL